MQNNFTYENTKGATHVRLYPAGQIEFFNINSDTYLGGKMEKFEPCWIPSGGRTRAKHIASHPEHYINLTDQTGRGYPTLEWFLAQGCKLEVGDRFTDGNGRELFISFNSESLMAGAKYKNENKGYVKSLHDNRHDLTAMARDEYYAKKKQWPNSERIDVIGQNGNNGEHYPHESESPLSPNFESKPVYTQEMHERGELPPVGAEYLDGDNQLCVCVGRTSVSDIIGEMKLHVSGGPYAAISIDKLEDVKPIDTRTDEEKLRDELIDCVEFDDDDASERSIKSFAVNAILNSDKFTITLK